MSPGLRIVSLIDTLRSLEDARTQPRQHWAGLDRARARGVRLAGKVETAIKERLTAGVGMLKVAKGLGVSTVQRVKAEMAVAPSS